jgi:4-alpha-glucanotransferase
VRSELQQLHRLAAFHGVETQYYDVNGSLVEASPEALLAVLRALGSSVESMRDVSDALAEAASLPGRPVEPVHVTRADQDVEIEVRVPPGAVYHLSYRLEIENGEVREREIDLDTLHPQIAEKQIGTDHEIRRLPLGGLPEGFHGLKVEIGGRTVETTIVAAPGRAWPLFPDEEHRAWGVFLPLYALRSRRDRGAGDLTDLESLSGWARRHGAEVIATLPLLSSFLDEPFDPSPYAPVSRMFWNEFYLDPERVPELECAEAARALLASPGFRDDVERVRDARMVNYRRVMALKRRVLSDLARAFFDSASEERRNEFYRFAGEYPRVEDYARFRAAVERNGGPWRGWPAPARDGILTAEDVDADAVRYHLYVQWLLDDALRPLGDSAGSDGAKLALDFPVGVHPDGYDVWRERDVFAEGVAVGAPPDEFFPGGQNWGFPPLHPGRSRGTGHRYWRECLGRHMRCASLLRIDHVMGLHRMFWIPDGFDPSEGVYVRCPTEELYAVATLESKRRRCAVVGEDLGTVPGKVRPTMSRHGFDRMHVVQFELGEDPESPLPSPPRGAIASLNTHDTPTFEGFWTERDIAERERLGLQDQEACRTMSARRRRQRGALLSYLRRKKKIRPDPDDEVVTAMTACLYELASGPARLVLVNVEDLWLEPEPHNVPGTSRERPNWRRKARYSLEEMDAVPEIDNLLRAVDARRRGRA